MKTAKAAVLVLPVTILMVAGCHNTKEAAVPDTMSNVRVVSASSPAAKFASGSTYAFVKLAEDSDLQGEPAMIEARIEKAMTAEMKKKGFKPSRLSDTTFFVVYTIGVAQQIDVLATKAKVQGNDWILAVAQPTDYVTGALLVEIIDAKTMEPVWLGVFDSDIAKIAVSEEAKKQRVAFAVSQVLKTFPPK